MTVTTEIAWLFVRAEESVRLEVTRQPDAYHLDVWGPGRARASHRFDTFPLAASAAEAHQNALSEQGFVLQARAERRGSGERRQDSKVHTDRRRR